MAIDADPHLVESFEARVINNFFERLSHFVHPQIFDLQIQVALAVQDEQRKMTDWREVLFLFLPLHYPVFRVDSSSHMFISST